MTGGHRVGPGTTGRDGSRRVEKLPARCHDAAREPVTHYPDLSPCDYFGAERADRLVAVGWLERGRDFSQGDVDAQFTAKLVDISRDPWEPGHFAGPHFCDFCRISRVAGTRNIFVPATGFVFVAPALVVHYVDAHEYAPPIEFQRAVLACPPMRSVDYLKAILANGPQGFASRPTASGLS